MAVTARDHGHGSLAAHLVDESTFNQFNWRSSCDPHDSTSTKYMVFLLPLLDDPDDEHICRFSLCSHPANILYLPLRTFILVRDDDQTKECECPKTTNADNFSKKKKRT